MAQANLQVAGALATGNSQAVTATTERVPIYLTATTDIVHMAVTFSIGDQKSPLHFQPASMAPTLTDDSHVGLLSAAWLLQGFTVDSGTKILLGYVTGPTGFSANLKMYGASAVNLDTRTIVRLTTGQ